MILINNFKEWKDGKQDKKKAFKWTNKHIIRQDTYRRTDKQTYIRQDTYRRTESDRTHTDGQTNRHIIRQDTYRRTDKQTYNQTGHIQTDRQTDI